MIFIFQFNLIKNLIYKIKATSEQKELLNSLQVGDLVWAKMPLSKKELKAIEESHKTRPYLVISKKSSSVLAYQSSSSSRKGKGVNNVQEYCLSKTRYIQSKNSWINLKKIYNVPICNLKEKHRTLENIDLMNIQKRLNVQNPKNANLISKEIRISDGDIIDIDSNMYYVYSSDNVFIYCFKVSKKNPKDGKEYKKIIVNNKTYYTTFKELQNFKRTEKMSIVNVAYPLEIDTISKQRKELKYREKNPIIIEDNESNDSSNFGFQRGTIFQVGTSKIVYLFKVKDKYMRS